MTINTEPRATLDSKKLETAHLLFPVEHGARTPFEILVPLTAHDVALLLEQMGRAAELGREDDRLEDLVYRDLFQFAYPRRTGSHRRHECIDACGDSGRAVHPSVAQYYRPAGPAHDIRVHVNGFYVYLTGMGENGPFTTYEAHFHEVMLCDLATAEVQEVPASFRRLAVVAPWIATAVLEDNLVLFPNPSPVRDIRSLLSPADIGPILETPFPDFNVRERAIACLGTVGRRVPGELA